jgi:carboxymethylenebutenolidase
VCHEPEARPPLPPIAGGAGIAGSDDLVLQASDGNRFLAHEARALDPAAPAIVVMPDVRGLHPFYVDLADRFAEAGVHAIAIDYFGRTAGTEPRDHDTFPFRSHVERTQPETIALDVASAVEHLREELGATRIFTIGFCMGGRQSFNQAARDLGLGGVIGFYGWPQRDGPDDADAPVDLAASYRCAVLGIFGGADRGIPVAEVERFRGALEAAGVEHEVAIEPEAPHSFFDRRADDFADASDDAWRRVLRFVGVAA